MDNSGLFAGAGRTTINPPLGIKTVGFSSREGVVERIESDLTSTAVVFALGDRRMAILAVDLCNPSIEMVTEWRAQVAAAIGTVPSHVMINLSHTHSGPPLPGRNPEFCFQDALIDGYYESLVPLVIESARRANAALQPARLAHGEGHSQIGINRREMGPDGYIFLGEDPPSRSTRWSVWCVLTTLTASPSRRCSATAATRLWWDLTRA